MVLSVLGRKDVVARADITWCLQPSILSALSWIMKELV